MSDELKVPKRRVQVEVFLAGGGARQVTVFLAGFASSHAGRERLSDLLNAAEGEFVPAIDADSDELMFLNRQSVAVAHVLREWESDEDLIGGLEHEVEIDLTDGTRLHGTVRYVMPPERSRLNDYLNDAQPFVRLEHDEKVTLVNKRHIARVAKVK
jgi:hypothetical protein